jgi:hypothetical protein
MLHSPLKGNHLTSYSDITANFFVLGDIVPLNIPLVTTVHSHEKRESRLNLSESVNSAPTGKMSPALAF